MGQKTKKSPTPSTAKKTGAGLPRSSPKGTPSSVPPAVFRRLFTVAAVDPNDFHDMVDDAQTVAEQRVSRLLVSLIGNPKVGSAAAAAVDSFVVEVVRAAPAEEIVLRGGSASAFARLRAEIDRDSENDRVSGGGL